MIRFLASRTAAATTLLLALTACSSSSAGTSGAAPGHGSTAGPASSSTSPAVTTQTVIDSGLSNHRDGYRISPTETLVPAGVPASYHFTVSGPDGRVVTRFATPQGQAMHLYAVRSDLTGYQHVHPEMAADGTWTTPLAALTPGLWRLYASFSPDAGPGKGSEFVLSRPLMVPGKQATTPLPAAVATTSVDGYTVSLRGDLTAATTGEVKIGVTRDGKPVTDLEPLQGTYAQVTAFRSGNMAFARLHPTAAVADDDERGGPELAFRTRLPQPGDWRVFVQFRAGGRLHTAALTRHAG